MTSKKMCLLGAAVFSLCFGLSACSSDDNQNVTPDGGSTPTLDHWQGATAHFWLEGTITQTNGGTPTPIKINIEGADATDTTKLHCRREYFADPMTDGSGNLDYSTATPSELKIYFDYTDSGDHTLKHGLVALKRHNFLANHAGDTVTAINRDGTTAAAADQFFLVFQANSAPSTDPSVTTLIKTTAQSGTYTHGEYQCTPDATNPKLCGAIGTHAANGDVGGFASGVWSASENLKVSFTAPCTVDFVEARPATNT